MSSQPVMRVPARLVAELPCASSGSVFWRGTARARETGPRGRQGAPVATKVAGCDGAEGGLARLPPTAERTFLDGEECVFVTASNRLVRTTPSGDYVHWAKQFPEDQPVLGAVCACVCECGCGALRKYAEVFPTRFPNVTSHVH